MRIDLHADTPLWQHWMGYDFCRGHRPWLPMGAWLANVDLPRMLEGGLDVQMFGLVSLPFEFDGYATILHMLRHLDAAEARSQGAFRLARSGQAYRALTSMGVRTGLLSVEGVHSLRGQLSRAEALCDAGVVSFGLAHFHANAACSPSVGLGARRNHGLSPFGHALLATLQSRRALVDLTHINRVGFFETLQTFPGRVHVSHTGVRGVHDIWRNIDDEQIRAIAARGGIIGVIFSRHFLGGNDIGAVVAHIKHLVKVGGEACAALGSDFDGFVVPVRGLRDITGLPALEEALLKAGLSPKAVQGIMGENAHRYLSEALP